MGASATGRRVPAPPYRDRPVPAARAVLDEMSFIRFFLVGGAGRLTSCYDGAKRVRALIRLLFPGQRGCGL
jgi:hypothetical protein